MYELFIDIYDGLYYPGYVEQMAKDHPERLKADFDEFLSVHDF